MGFVLLFLFLFLSRDTLPCQGWKKYMCFCFCFFVLRFFIPFLFLSALLFSAPNLSRDMTLQGPGKPWHFGYRSPRYRVLSRWAWISHPNANQKCWEEKLDKISKWQLKRPPFSRTQDKPPEASGTRSLLVWGGLLREVAYAQMDNCILASLVLSSSHVPWPEPTAKSQSNLLLVSLGGVLSSWFES